MMPVLPAVLALAAVVSLGSDEDRGRIAFYSGADDQAEIFLVDPDGSRLTRLTSNGFTDERLTDMPDGSFWPAWGPDDESRSRSPRQADVGVPVVIGEELPVDSEALGRKMWLDVYLPPGYAEGTARYPVLYTFQSFFHHVSGIADYLAQVNAAPPLIVASVRNYSSADLSPEVLPSNPDSGGASRFLRFFADELVPTIDARYRTVPYRLMYAGSFGGGFVVYSALVRPETFNAYLAATPAIDYEGQSRFIATNAASWLRENEFHNRLLFMAVEDAPALAATMEAFTALLRQVAPVGLAWEYHHWPEEDHATLPHRAIFQGLRRAFDRWSRLPPEVAAGGAAGIRAYADDLAAWYGFDIGLSRTSLFRAVNDRLEAGDADEASRIAELLVELHPRDELACRLLGRTLERAGRLDDALAAYERAYALAVENHSPHVGVIKGSLDTLRRKIRPPSVDRAPVRDRG